MAALFLSLSSGTIGDLHQDVKNDWGDIKKHLDRDDPKFCKARRTFNICKVTAGAGSCALDSAGTGCDDDDGVTTCLFKVSTDEITMNDDDCRTKFIEEVWLPVA